MNVAIFLWSLLALATSYEVGKWDGGYNDDSEGYGVRAGGGHGYGPEDEELEDIKYGGLTGFGFGKFLFDGNKFFEGSRSGGVRFYGRGLNNRPVLSGHSSATNGYIYGNSGHSSYGLDRKGRYRHDKYGHSKYGYSNPSAYGHFGNGRYDGGQNSEISEPIHVGYADIQRIYEGHEAVTQRGFGRDKLEIGEYPSYRNQGYTKYASDEYSRFPVTRAGDGRYPSYGWQGHTNYGSGRYNTFDGSRIGDSGYTSYGKQGHANYANEGYSR